MNAAKARQSSKRPPTPVVTAPSAESEDEDEDREDKASMLAGLKVLAKRQEGLKGRSFTELFPEVVERIIAAEAAMMLFFRKKELKALSFGPEYAQQALAALAVARNLILSLSSHFIQFPPGKIESLSESELDSLLRLLKPSEETERARRECGEAMQRYLESDGDDGSPLTQQEQSRHLVTKTTSWLQEEVFDEKPPETLASAVFQVVSRWLQDSSFTQTLSIQPGSIAEAMLKLPEPPEGALEQAHKAAVRAMVQAPLGPRSEEAVRRAFIAWCEGLGASSKDANNWFRP